VPGRFTSVLATRGSMISGESRPSQKPVSGMKPGATDGDAIGAE